MRTIEKKSLINGKDYSQKYPTLTNTFSNHIKIFPNPVQSKSDIHIEWTEKEYGYFTLQLFSVSGQQVFSKEIYIDEEARLLSVDLPSLVPGNYFLKMTNKETGKYFSDQIVVN